MISSKSIFSSLIWKFLERSGTQLVQFIVSIVLARLLSPEDFGVIALVMIFIQLASVFIESGLSSALVQKKNADNLDFSSVFWGTIIVAIFLYILLFFLSPFIANYFEKPILESVLRILGLTLFFGVFNSIQAAYIARNMLFKILFYRSLGAIIPSGIIGIILAYLKFGIWALVGQQLSNVFFMCIIMWFTVKWRPNFLFSFKRIKSLFSYGSKLLVSSLIDIGYNNLHSLVIGKMFTPAILGFYTRGNQFPNLIVNNINYSIQSVMLPVLSKEQDDLLKIKKMTRRSMVTSSFVIFPLMAWLAAVAEPLVLVILGEKWLPCVPFLQIYCLIYSFWPIHTSNLSAIKALGKSGLYLKLEIIKKSLGLCILFYTIFFFHSPIPIALGAALTGVISTLINAHPNKKLLSYGYLEQIKDILPYFILSVIMGLGLWWLTKFFFSPILLLIILTFIGALFYLGIAKIFHFECLDYLFKTVLQLKKK